MRWRLPSRRRAGNHGAVNAPIQKLFTAPDLSPAADGMMSKNRHFARGPALPARAALLAAGLLALVTPAHAQRAQFQGRSDRFPPPQGREISDQEHAKYRRDSGQNRSFDELFQRARSVGRGEYLGVEPDISSNIYRFKFMRPSGNVVWVDMDSRTGRVLAERE
jgi:hypothetical protein